MTNHAEKKDSELNVVKAEMCDAEMIAELEEKSFSDPWSVDFIRRWIKERNSGFLIAKNDHVLLGYIGFRTVMDTSEIDTLAVHPEYKHQGIGKEMIRCFFQEQVRNKIVQIFLEVRETNRHAIALYQKSGFRQVGYRKNYYQDTGESALLMEYKLPG